MIGKCEGMCPIQEIKWREKERLLHRFEIQFGTEKLRRPKADVHKMVKEYSRPAAGQSSFHPEDLRPSMILRTTVEYLLQNIVPLTESWATIYQFVCDRLRAVCQDMTVQSLNDSNCIWILEAAVRFYILSSYKLCEETALNVYDSHINHTLLMECLKRLLVMYSESNNTSKCEDEMVSYYLTYNLGSSEALHYALKLTERIRKSSITELALKINFLYINGHYNKVLKYYHKTDPLYNCCLHQHVELIRFRYLHILSVGFNCKNSYIPVSILSTWLNTENSTQTMEICKYYGLKMENDLVYFTKASFNNQKQLKTTKKNHVLNNCIECLNLSDLLSGVGFKIL